MHISTYLSYHRHRMGQLRLSTPKLAKNLTNTHGLKSPVLREQHTPKVVGNLPPKYFVELLAPG